MSTKRLLILGAGRGQIGLYKAAKEMGITTIAGTMPGAHLPCVTLADEVCYMDIADPEEVTEKSGESESGWCSDLLSRYRDCGIG